jgi:hypothetical protein
MKPREYMVPFATAIFAKKTALPSLSGAYASRMRESIKDDIKKASNFHPHDVSVRAHQKAQSLPTRVELKDKTWHDQNTFDPGRELFLVEHMRTVSSLADACIKAETESQVLDILTDQLSVVWILREEDDELTRLKFRSKRTDDAYEAAGIEIRKSS